MNPETLRAEAAQKRAQAGVIFNRHNSDGAEHTEAELKEFDGLMNAADLLLIQAAEVQTRQDRFNAADAAGRQSQGRQAPDMPHNDVGNTRNGRLGYSLLKALRQMDPASKGVALDGIELETHQELLKRRHGSGHKLEGALIPWDLPVDTRASGGFVRTSTGVERRDLTTTTGAGAVMTTTLPTMIELLRVRTLLYSLGAGILSDMEGNFVIPRQSGSASLYWINPESATVTKSNQTIDNVAYSPKTAGMQTVYSRSFLHQTGVDAEMFVRSDFGLVMAIGLDNAGLAGTGSGSQPTGILYDAGTTVIALGTNGAAQSWQTLVNHERQVETNNALLGNLAYVTSPSGRYALKTTVKDANTAAKYLWDVDNGNTVNGYPAFSSNQIPSTLTKGTGTALSGLIFGNFADALFAFWGGLDVIVNPFTNSNSGAVEITMLQDADFHVRHGKSFSVCKDFLTG